MKLYQKRKCKGALGSTRNIVKNKIGVKSLRLKELEALRKQISSEALDKALVVTAINLDKIDSDYLFTVGSEVTCVEIGAEAWKEAIAIFSGQSTVDAVILKIKGDELMDIERCLIALSFMRNVPVAIVATADTEAATEAREITAGSMPVFNKLEDAVQSVKHTIPELLHLRDVVQKDIAKRVEKYKKVNLIKHFGKRAAVALIPFAVSAVNFAGLIRLVKRMMAKTGMVVSKDVAKTVGGHTVVATAQALIIDEMGDLYQYAVAATIVADLSSTLFSEGVGAALATLDAVDFALLGSVSVVTGTLSAIGAYITRPQLVDAIAKFLATLQVIYLLNKEMRRPVSSEEDTANIDSSDESTCSEELLEVVTTRSNTQNPLLTDHDRTYPSDALVGDGAQTAPGHDPSQKAEHASGELRSGGISREPSGGQDNWGVGVGDGVIRHELGGERVNWRREVGDDGVRRESSGGRGNWGGEVGFDGLRSMPSKNSAVSSG